MFFGAQTCKDLDIEPSFSIYLEFGKYTGQIRVFKSSFKDHGNNGCISDKERKWSVFA